MREVAELGLVAVGASFLQLAIRAFGASQVVTWYLASVGFIPGAGI